jgi:hypothetical protein
LVVLAPVDEHLAGAQRLGLACDDEVRLGALEQLSDLSGERLGLGEGDVAVERYVDLQALGA